VNTREKMINIVWIFFGISLVITTSSYSKTLYEGFKTQTLLTSMEILDNTDNCLTDCYAEIEVCNKNPFLDSTMTKDNFNIWFTDKNTRTITDFRSTTYEKSKLKDFRILIEQPVTKQIEVRELQECKETKCYIDYETKQEVCECDIVKHYELREVKEWVPFDEVKDSKLLKNSCVKLRIEGTKEIGENIDWKIRLFSLNPNWAWWNTTFPYARNNTVVSNGTLTNFPYLLNGTDYFNTSSLIAEGKLDSDCDGIRMVNSSQNLELSFEIANNTLTTYGCNQPKTEIWVRNNVSSGSNNQDSVFYTDTSVASGEDKTGVWDSNYHLVYHFSEGESPIHKSLDSTSNNYDLITITDNPTTTWSTGVFGNAIDCDGGDTIKTANQPFSRTATETIEVWVNTTDACSSTRCELVSMEAEHRIKINAGDSGKPICDFGGGGGGASTTAINDGVWHYIVCTTDGTNTRIYIDGVLEDTTEETPSTGSLSGRFLGICGDGYNGGYKIDGQLDEVRYSGVTRTAEYINETYHQYLSTKFSTLGTEETDTPADPNTNITVTLDTPADNNLNDSLTVEFVYTPLSYGDVIYNCSLFTNISSREDNISSITNNTKNSISETFPDNGNYSWNVKCYNSTNGVFASSNYTINIYFPDIISPQYQDITENTADPSTYSSTQNYGFQVNFTDETAMDTVLFSHNATGSWINETCSNTTDIYYFNYTGFPTGVINYTFYGNDTTNNVNTTDYNTFIVNKATSTCNLYLNDTDGNRNYDNPEGINVTFVVSTSEGDVYIDSNHTGWVEQTSTSPSLENITEVTSIDAQYNFTGYYPATENYTACEETHYMVVTELFSKIVFDIEEPTGTYTSPYNYILNFSTTNSYNTTSECSNITDFDMFENVQAIWRLDEGTGLATKDDSGKNKTMNFTNTPTWTHGIYGKGLNFGENNYTKTDNNEIEAQEMNISTMSLWLKTSTSCGGDLCRILDIEGEKRIGLHADDSDKVSCVGSSIADRIFGTSNVVDGNWHMVTCVFNDTHSTIYVDGLLENTTEIYVGSAVTDRSTTIGAGYDGGNGYTGIVDEVYIWNRSITADNVLDLYYYTQPTSISNNTYTSSNISVDNDVINHDIVVQCRENLLGTYEWFYDNSSFTVINTGMYFSVFDESDESNVTFNITISNSTDSVSQLNVLYYNKSCYEENLPIGYVTVSISSYGYETRSYEYTFSSCDDIIDEDLYLLSTSDGSLTRFHVETISGNVIIGTEINAYKSIGGSLVIIDNSETDDAGVGTFWLDPTATYTMEFIKSGYESQNVSIVASSSDYTIVLTAESDDVIENELDNIIYRINPQNNVTNSTTNNVTFSFFINSTDSKLEWFSLNVTHDGVNLFSDNITDQPGGGTIEQDLNMSLLYGGKPVIVTAMFKKENITEPFNMTHSFFIWKEGSGVGTDLKSIAESFRIDMDLDNSDSTNKIFTSIGVVIFSMIAGAVVSNKSGSGMLGIIVLGIGISMGLLSFAGVGSGIIFGTIFGLMVLSFFATMYLRSGL